MVDVNLEVVKLKKEQETSNAALALCATEAAWKLLRECEIALLQPIMRAEVTTTSDFVGGVITDLTAVRQANVMGIDMVSDDIQVRAVPATAQLLSCFLAAAFGKGWRGDWHSAPQWHAVGGFATLLTSAGTTSLCSSSKRK